MSIAKVFPTTNSKLDLLSYQILWEALLLAVIYATSNCECLAKSCETLFHSSNISSCQSQSLNEVSGELVYNV